MWSLTEWLSTLVDRVPVIPEFLGNSHLSVRGLRDTSWTETLVEVTFLPKAATGLILYSGFSFDTRGDFICVALVRGRIIVSLDLGRGPSFRRSSRNLTLNSWHTLGVKRRGRSFSICLNGGRMFSGPDTFTHGSFVQLTIMDELYVGGMPNPDRISAYLPDYQELVSYKSVKGFVGCIQSVSRRQRECHQDADDIGDEWTHSEGMGYREVDFIWVICQVEQQI
ncbi:unnamed protein product [Hydatigera taeniaeformis]|uniref:LAM_G_DOMAIN domain-containing protein n=1 Tax=Hydatigena taeniaeformis TaxID=6205 RepID=A0A0R3WXL1_HYDTA|nr:unnamed protein product [Hydatigera taeniaeformis]